MAIRYLKRTALQESFSWTKQWYPLAFVNYLDPKVCLMDAKVLW